MSAFVAPGRVKLLGAGSAFPGKLVTNDELLEKLESLTSLKTARTAARLADRLGIVTRYLSRSLDIADSGPMFTSQKLAASAIQAAAPGPFDYLISHTATPHTLLPSGAAWIADELEHRAPYMELRQACTGFASSLQIAVPMLNSPGGMTSVAVAGVEVGSVYFRISENFIDLSQLINYVQMGDGAGAVVLGPDDGEANHMISHCFTGHIGLNTAPGFYLKDGGSMQPFPTKGIPTFAHDARSVRGHGPLLFKAGVDTVRSLGFEPSDFEYILPHQANGFMDELVATALRVPKNKVINDAKNWGNLGSAAIWTSFAKLINSDLLNAGDRVLVLGAEATKYMYGGFIYQH